MSDIYRLGGNAGKAFKGLVQELDNLDDEAKEISERRKEIKQRAKSQGYDVKALLAARKLASQDKKEREDFDALVETYLIQIEEQ